MSIHPREAVILAQIRGYLRLLQGVGLLEAKRINVGPILRSARGRTVYQRNTEMIGMPDLLVWLKNGPCLAIEVKAMDGRMSPEQKEFQMRLIALGHRYFVARSLDAVVELLREYGIDHFSNRPRGG